MFSKFAKNDLEKYMEKTCPLDYSWTVTTRYRTWADYKLIKGAKWTELSESTWTEAANGVPYNNL